MIKIVVNIFVSSCLLFTFYSCNLTSKKGNTIDIDETKDDVAKLESTSQKIDADSDDLFKFVPINYSILDSVSGDLNLDGISDYILVLKQNGEDTLSDVVNNPSKRPLLILIRDKNNQLQLTRRNDNTVYCVDCGGILGDPYTGITIKNGYFSIEHYGGSAWRWTRIITYKYLSQENEWLLHKDGYESFHTSDPENIDIQIKTRKDFGKVKFEDFDIYKD